MENAQTGPARLAALTADDDRLTLKLLCRGAAESRVGAAGDGTFGAQSMNASLALFVLQQLFSFCQITGHFLLGHHAATSTPNEMGRLGEARCRQSRPDSVALLLG